MNAVIERIRPAHDEKVTHVAFRCGCVRSFRPYQHMEGMCLIHKELPTSVTEEFYPLLEMPEAMAQ